MNSNVIELVIFQTNPGINKADLMAAADQTMVFLQKLDGFISRELSLTENESQWVDIVHWQDLNTAQQAADKFIKAPECQEFLAMIDIQQMTMLHLNSVLTKNV
ncbi:MULTISPECIES: hypothetical protein [unclassified Anabaena]|uniref:hypothetical protein n=1 Tax=unclassified Anabaena TaxID=2619674 RepID=UPI0039C7473C